MDAFVMQLLAAEDRAVTEVMAFMSYNPSIGRVLEKGGVAKFQKMMTSAVESLPAVQSRGDFDQLHRECVSSLLANFKTSRNSQPSYGQGQKPVNVFFKVYVDWARKPDDQTRGRLLPHLHVPLDSIVMKSIRKQYPAWYRSRVKPLIKAPAQEFSLSKIDEELYLVREEFFREQHPAKPLLFDILWAMKRRLPGSR
jgi:hypothetical protein